MIQAGTGKRIPRWIGVRRDWKERGDDPLLSLVGLGPEELRTHALAVGATGSGKTNLLHHLIAQDVARGHSVAVLDLRGDLVDAALRICAGKVEPEEVALFDLREKERPAGFDPLFGPGEAYFRALSVLEAISNEAESWGVQLAETLRNALLVLAEAGERLTGLERIFFDAEFRKACLARIERSPAADFWARYGALSAEKQSALAAPVLNKVSLLFATGGLRRMLGHPSPADLSRQVNRPGTVTLVSLAVDELHGAGRMVGNLLLSAICREAFARVKSAERDRNPIRLYVDEFEHFASPEFETVLAEGRRFGLSLVVAHQSLAQVPPKLRSLVLANVGVKFAFRCGREDSAAMCKDVAGDPAAYDLGALPPGTALLWVKGHGRALVEINEPMFPGGPLRDGQAAEFREAVLRSAAAADPAELPDVAACPPESERLPSGTEPLEDWL